MAKEIDPKISKMMSEFSKRRKQPFLAFKDRELASKAGKLGARKRWEGHEKKSTHTITETKEDI